MSKGTVAYSLALAECGFYHQCHENVYQYARLSQRDQK